MNELETKQRIANALSMFSSGSLRENGVALLNSLGYQSEREILLFPNNLEGLVDMHPPFSKLNREKALTEDWLSVDILFQLTGDDIRNTAQSRFIFDTVHRVDDQIIESYLFLAIHLKQGDYSRSKLAGITREFNRFSAMPVMILFQYGDCLTLAIIRRRLNKKDETKEVLEKVTLIKDIRYMRPHRAHIEILADFHLDSLHNDFRVNNFVQLANAWERRLGTYDLTERFYRDIANWYFATSQDTRIVYPRSIQTPEHRSMFLIRLLTRLIFCWFLQEKGLIPGEVFSYQKASELLRDSNPASGTYYRGILQNLFFATLNQVQGDRKFRSKTQKPSGRDGNRGATQYYRYEDLFIDAQELINQLKEVPFLNGGLFECLDTVYKKEENRPNIRFDDFSEENDNGLFIPNDIFFGKEHTVDLSKVYDDARKRREKTRGLIDILDSYKFTIEENTPLEEEIALDPELLGKVFENLLASYNEDTKTTARKSTGSFYTPREIVAYMVDETVLTYLKEQVPDVDEEDLRTLLNPTSTETDLKFSDQQKQALIEAIENVRVLDPACGSGAFPMGMLQRLVSLLAKLDPYNITFKRQRLLKAQRDLLLVEKMEDEEIKEAAREEANARITDIQHSFDNRFHELDFARKLYLIEDCIYGVDIQPVAVQIAKLRFFITLIVDQKTDRGAPNHGVRPLPNLETKLVAADSLLPLTQSAQLGFGDYAVDRLREQLRQVRHEYFRAKDPTRKAECRIRDAELRKLIAGELQKAGWPASSAEKLAGWDPYDPNKHADFFEPKWMFGGQARNLRPASGTVRGHFNFVNELDGQMELTTTSQDDSEEWLFDIVLGNPPYVRQEQIKDLKPILKPIYECYVGTADLYVYFYERGIKLLRKGGAFAFITSNKWMRTGYGEGLRKWLSKNTTVKQIIDFGDEPIFTAIAYPCIVILIHENGLTKKSSEESVSVLNWQPDWDISHFLEIYNREKFMLPQKELSNDSWQITSSAERKLFEQVIEKGEPFSQYINGKFYRGVTTGLNEAFVVDAETRDQLISSDPTSNKLIHPLLRGKDVKRWNINFKDLYLIFTRRGTDISKYPAILEYLSRFKKQLTPGIPGGRKPGPYEWFEIQDNTAYWQDFERPKIIFPDIAIRSEFTYDINNHYLANTMYMIPTEETWLLSILNSSLILWYYQKISPQIQSSFLRFTSQYVSQIPIPSVNQIQRTLLSRLVEYNLFLSGTGNAEQPRISAFENLLNSLVYELFFTKELDSAGIKLFNLLERSTIPEIRSIQHENRYQKVCDVHNDLFLNDHPIRSALFSLRGFDFVRIFEDQVNKTIEVSLDETEED